MKKLCMLLDTKWWLVTERKTNKRRIIFMEKKAITIFTASKARELLKDGRFTLIDIKPDKTDPDGKRSVFVFKNEEGLLEKIKEK